MPRRAASRRSGPIWPIVLACLGSATPAFAFPDGVPWEAARGEVCHACHFDRPVAAGSTGLAVEGLPLAVRPGEEYPLTIRLDDPAMRRAGFLLSAMHGPEEAGRMRPADGRSEVRGARARATAAGSELSGADASEWTVIWRAPETVPGPIAFEIWSVAANGDESPLGDRVHELTVEVRQATGSR